MFSYFIFGQCVRISSANVKLPYISITISKPWLSSSFLFRLHTNVWSLRYRTATNLPVDTTLSADSTNSVIFIFLTLVLWRDSGIIFRLFVVVYFRCYWGRRFDDNKLVCYVADFLERPSFTGRQLNNVIITTHSAINHTSMFYMCSFCICAAITFLLWSYEFTEQR